MRVGIIGLLLVGVHTLGATLFQYLRIGGIAPNFMIMIIVSFALLRGSREGVLMGLVAGLLNDISFGMHIGPTMFSYALIGYVCGKFNKNFYRENFIIPFLCTLFSSLFYSIVQMIVLATRDTLNIINFLRSFAIPELIYTIMLSLIVYQLSYLLNAYLEEKEKNTRNIF